MLGEALADSLAEALGVSEALGVASADGALLEAVVAGSGAAVGASGVEHPTRPKVSAATAVRASGLVSVRKGIVMMFLRSVFAASMVPIPTCADEAEMG